MACTEGLKIEVGLNGYCLLTFICGKETYSLPLVYFDGIGDVVSTNFYKWLELAKEYTHVQSALSAVKIALEDQLDKTIRGKEG